MGFSVISLIEIIYFFSIRPICALKRAEYERSARRGGIKHPSSMIANVHDHDVYHVKPSQSTCKEMQVKMISGTRYIKAKISSVWNSIVEMSENEMGRAGQIPTAPFPYLD